jgi:hypothetical protein
MLATLLLTALSAIPGAQGDVKKDPLPKLELFAKEDWYKNQQGKEVDVTGVLKKVESPKQAGFGRFNPYQLTITTIETVPVQVKVGDKIVTEYRQQLKVVEREVYVGGKNGVLDPYVGKTVKLTGKPVLMKVEGRTHDEIWPARLEVVQSVDLLKKLAAPGLDEDCCEAGDSPKELKIHGKTRWQ